MLDDFGEGTMGSPQMPTVKSTIHWMACPEAAELPPEPGSGHSLSVAVPPAWPSCARVTRPSGSLSI